MNLPAIPLARRYIDNVLWSPHRVRRCPSVEIQATRLSSSVHSCLQLSSGKKVFLFKKSKTPPIYTEFQTILFYYISIQSSLIAGLIGDQAFRITYQSSGWQPPALVYLCTKQNMCDIETFQHSMHTIVADFFTLSIQIR